MGCVFLNGEFIPAEKAKVSVLDRGFLFGDGVYEVIPVYHRHSFTLIEHLERLERSLDAINIPNPYNQTQWRDIINKLVSYQETEDQGVYLQVTRGAPLVRDHVVPDGVDVAPTVFAMSRPILTTMRDIDDISCITAVTLNDIRWNRCDIKSISLLGNVLLKESAAKAGADEAILLRDGLVTEGAASNCFAVVDGVIRTAPCDHRLLGGVTRDLIVKLLQESELPFSEVAVTEEELMQVSELWMTSSTKEIMAVTSLNGAILGGGAVGPLCKQTSALYLAYKEKFIAGTDNDS